jgi:hypothetical protein
VGCEVTAGVSIVVVTGDSIIRFPVHREIRAGCRNGGR